MTLLTKNQEKHQLQMHIGISVPRLTFINIRMFMPEYLKCSRLFKLESNEGKKIQCLGCSVCDTVMHEERTLQDREVAASAAVHESLQVRRSQTRVLGQLRRQQHQLSSTRTRADSLRQQLKVRDALMQLLKVRDALMQQLKVSDAIGQQLKVRDALRQQLKVSDALMQQLKVKEALMQELKVSGALRQQLKVTDELMQQLKVRDALRQQHKVRDALGQQLNGDGCYMSGSPKLIRIRMAMAIASIKFAVTIFCPNNIC